MLVKAVIVVGRYSFGHSPMRGANAIPALEAVANRPIIEHVIDAICAASVSAPIVVGESEALMAVRECVGDGVGGVGRPAYVTCEENPDMAATLRAVAPLVGDSPCLLQPADGLLGEPVASLVGSLSHGSPDLVLHVRDLTETVFGDEHHGTGVSVPGRSEPEVAVFGPGVLRRATDALRAREPGDLALVAERLAAAGGSVRFQLTEGWRRYDGDGADLLELNRIALDGLVPDVRPSLRRENRIEGRVLIHPSASARDSVIVGPTVIGPGARIENAYLGAYTSVGAGAHIAGAEIERSIISPGASVVHVGGRLVSSLVGRDARVFRDFSLPRAMRLWVGDGGEVALC